MRKRILLLISFILLLSIFLGSCVNFKALFPIGKDESETETETETETEAETETETETETGDETETETVWDSVTVPYEYKSVIHMCTENAMLTHRISENFHQTFYIDLSVDENIQKNILGKEYWLSYVNSIIMHESGVLGHVYSLDGYSYSQIIIDAMDGSIIKYVQVPYDEELITEEDYKNFIIDMVDDRMDVSKYEYSCSTKVSVSSDKASWSETIKGFVIPIENQTLQWYDMYYFGRIGGIRTDEGVEATFYDGKRFSMDIVKRDYDERTFLPFIETFDELESHTYDLIKNSVSDDVVFVDTYVTGYSFFTRNGVPCVKVSSSVSNDMIYPTGKTTYTGFVQTISYLVPA